MDYDPCSSNEDRDNRENPGEGESPSESIEEEATLPSPRLRCPFSSGSITALWGPRTSVLSADENSGRWDQEPLLQLGFIRWPSTCYNAALRPGKHHLGQRIYLKENFL